MQKHRTSGNLLQSPEDHWNIPIFFEFELPILMTRRLTIDGSFERQVIIWYLLHSTEVGNFAVFINNLVDYCSYSIQGGEREEHLIDIEKENQRRIAITIILLFRYLRPTKKIKSKNYFRAIAAVQKKQHNTTRIWDIIYDNFLRIIIVCLLLLVLSEFYYIYILVVSSCFDDHNVPAALFFLLPNIHKKYIYYLIINNTYTRNK